MGPAVAADGGRRPRPTPEGGGGAIPPADPGGENLRPEPPLPIPRPVGRAELSGLSPTASDEMPSATLNGIGDAERGVELEFLDWEALPDDRGVEKLGCTFG